MGKKNIGIGFFVVAVSLFVLHSCANIVTPTGGPKDKTAPVVLTSQPANGSANYNQSSISITFDEYVTLNNASQNILFSPPLAQKPNYSLSGKTLNITLKEQLKANTTYSISFGEAIKDLHEGNVFSDFHFVFSTGAVVDSLSMAGSVFDAQTGKAVEKAWVMLYSAADGISLDSLPHQVKPNFVTKTDKQGHFRLSGLPDRPFLLFALNDQNSNLLFDLPNESIAFTDSLLRPVYINTKLQKKDIKPLDSLNLKSDSLSQFVDTLSMLRDTLQIGSVDTLLPAMNIKLLMFIQEDSIQQLLKKEAVSKGQYRFTFRYPIAEDAVKIIETLPDIFQIKPVFSSRRDTLTYFFTPNKDRLLFQIKLNEEIDTLQVSLQVRTKKTKSSNKDKYLKISNNTSSKKIKPDTDFVLRFDEPIQKVNMHSTNLWVAGKDTTINVLNFEQTDDFGFKYRLNADLQMDSTYKLMVPDSVFFSVTGKTNDTIRAEFQVQNYNKLGSLFVKVIPPKDVKQVVFYLVNENDKVLTTLYASDSTELEFYDLAPAKYKLKALLDRDGNGVWSPGNYDKHMQSEIIKYYPDTFEIKANWDIDLAEPWRL